MSYAMDLMEHWRTSCPPAAESLRRLTMYHGLWEPDQELSYQKKSPHQKQKDVADNLAALAMQTGIRPASEAPAWIREWSPPEVKN